MSALQQEVSEQKQEVSERKQEVSELKQEVSKLKQELDKNANFELQMTILMQRMAKLLQDSETSSAQQKKQELIGELQILEQQMVQANQPAVRSSCTNPL